MKKALCIIMASNLYICAIAENRLSVSEAIEAISLLNAKDVYELDSLLTLNIPSNDIASNIVTGIVKVIKQYNYEYFYGRNLIACVLETHKSATKVEQTTIEKEITNSVEEYSFTQVVSFKKALAALVLFPVGIPWLIYKQNKHTKQIDEQRARDLHGLKNIPLL